MKYLTEAKYVSRWAPVAALILVEASRFGQIARMVTEQTAAGQSLLSWIGIFMILGIWYHFYRVVTLGDDGNVARWSTLVGMLTTLGVIFTIIWFRYF